MEKCISFLFKHGVILMAPSRGGFSGIGGGGDVDMLQVLEGVIAARAARHGQGNRLRHGILDAIFRVAQRGKLTEAGTVVKGDGLQLKKGRLQAGETGGKYRDAAQHSGGGSKHLAVLVKLMAVLAV
eukprot:evm.model.NODE_15062_length_17973_cov_53.697601.3